MVSGLARRTGLFPVVMASSIALMAWCAVAGDPPWSVQVALVSVGVVLVGIPHGALDIEVMLRGPDRNVFRLLCGYVGLVAMSVFVFRLTPVLGMGLFFVASAWHFGSADGHRVSLMHEIFVWTRGGLVVTALLFRDPSVSARVLADLAISLPAEWGTMALLLASGVHAGVVLGLRRTALWVETCLLIAMGWVLPPVLFFGVYFLAWHSLSHLLRVKAVLRDGSTARIIAAAIGWTAAALVVSLGAFWMLGTGSGSAFSPIVVMAISVTLPHLLVVEFYMKAEPNTA